MVLHSRVRPAPSALALNLCLLTSWNLGLMASTPNPESMTLRATMAECCKTLAVYRRKNPKTHRKKGEDGANREKGKHWCERRDLPKLGLCWDFAGFPFCAWEFSASGVLELCVALGSFSPLTLSFVGPNCGSPNTRWGNMTLER